MFKAYLVLGLFICTGLGAAFATGMKAPNLGIVDGFQSAGSGTGSGRGYFHSSGWSFGK